MDKPKYFYHASPNHTILSVLEPRAETIRDDEDGKVVFATPDIAYASCFLNRNDSSWVQHGRFGKGNPFYCVISDERRFRENDNGGIIYTLPNTSFYYDNKYGTGDMEWLSKEAVIPIVYNEYEFALHTMLQLGVQVYFVTQDQYTQVWNAEDYGLKFLNTMKSENQKLGINVRTLFPL